MKNVPLILAAAMTAFSACSPTFYQVYDVEAPGLQETVNYLKYENEDCALYYSLWDQSGSLSFILENKTDQDIYLMMSNSFFIRNGQAIDYYSDRTYSTSTTSTGSASVSKQATMYGYLYERGELWPASVAANVKVTKSVATTKGVTETEPEVICIPAKSSKAIGNFSISSYVYLDCDKSPMNFPNKVSETRKYTRDISPLVFRNRIAYSFSRVGTDLKYIDNEFWVKQFTNYRDKEATMRIDELDCTTGLQLIKRVLKMESPSSFYNTYTKTTNRGTKKISKDK